jgi:hypothetical protein
VKEKEPVLLSIVLMTQPLAQTALSVYQVFVPCAQPTSNVLLTVMKDLSVKQATLPNMTPPALLKVNAIKVNVKPPTQTKPL